MKYYWKILSLFVIVFLLMYGIPVRASLPLQGKVIVVDAGHGGIGLTPKKKMTINARKYYKNKDIIYDVFVL